MISVNNLSKSYNGQRVFSSLNFSVNKGEVLGIIGGNGSGKSTLLKILSKISLPDSGDILISPDISIDYLGHENMFYEEMSIEENIALLSEKTLSLVNAIPKDIKTKKIVVYAVSYTHLTLPTKA